jgi:hypothetical protein
MVAAACTAQQVMPCSSTATAAGCRTARYAANLAPTDADIDMVVVCCLMQSLMPNLRDVVLESPLSQPSGLGAESFASPSRQRPRHPVSFGALGE